MAKKPNMAEVTILVNAVMIHYNAVTAELQKGSGRDK
jgi:hypothetical protein